MFNGCPSAGIQNTLGRLCSFGKNLGANCFLAPPHPATVNVAPPCDERHLLGPEKIKGGAFPEGIKALLYWWIKKIA